METRLLTTNHEDLCLAAEIIAAGGLVAFPTETVYGLGGDAMNPSAAALIYEAKGRPSDNPLIVHLARPDDAVQLAEWIPDAFDKLAARFWPGPLTMVVPKKAAVPDATTGGLSTVAMRMPDNPAALEMIRLAQTPVAAPSANLSGRPSPTCWEHVWEDMNGRIDAIITGEPSPGGIESTVLDLTGSVPTILRPGLVTPEEIGGVLGQLVPYDPAILGSFDPEKPPRAPGMKYRHYAPRAEMVVYRGDPEAVVRAVEARRLREVAAGRSVEVLLYGREENRLIAREFFSRLRQADETGADLILAAAVSAEDSIGFSIMNRMLKAAGYRIEEVTK
ncbi:MAG: L-threonylcarbamoyladenylate synthase [Bacillota bacterium]|jgi:L-threonylcarbamoyladenylate synthase|nr:L-threonylcarbamoyladenylate synthase [Eubacteriales bacterium]MDI9491525.1 L-threonylcarbamoyladenylate synthase [Bacillota bacterium]NLV70432.1 threonylcarbamoyl-AMP synthase [Clostridiales bacterium]MDD3536824.1 L-threonylcarbamoyladenylate synthase [Eubacteriales bacterium]MDD4285486.1 L-threonylcarbamoyladenylate synthase [Eubacteriales bacterium]